MVALSNQKELLLLFPLLLFHDLDKIQQLKTTKKEILLGQKIISGKGNAWFFLCTYERFTAI